MLLQFYFMHLYVYLINFDILCYTVWLSYYNKTGPLTKQVARQLMLTCVIFAIMYEICNDWTPGPMHECQQKYCHTPCKLYTVNCSSVHHLLINIKPHYPPSPQDNTKGREGFNLFLTQKFPQKEGGWRI